MFGKLCFQCFHIRVVNLKYLLCFSFGCWQSLRESEPSLVCRSTITQKAMVRAFFNIRNILSQAAVAFDDLTLVQISTIEKRLMIIRRYLVHSLSVGCVAALVCTLWTAYWSAYYATPWVEAWTIFRSFLTFWLVWSLTLSVVLPAVLSDEFSK